MISFFYYLENVINLCIIICPTPQGQVNLSNFAASKNDHNFVMKSPIDFK